MRVCITEKPSVAKDIAAILGANVRHNGYFEGHEVRVTWTFGHLCTLKEPADYTERWSRWALSVLPMLPPNFSIKLIDNETYKKQFEVIRTLVSQADEVVNCGDAGQEGELIQRWVLQKAGVKCPVYRLWISSLTEEAIREGFRSLKPAAEFDNLYYAGLSRAVGDWILGMNATRLYSLKYSSPGKVLSVGRVQTPTLALLVARQQEIDRFTPEDSWEISTKCKGAVFNAVGKRFPTEEEAQELLWRLKGLPLEILEVTEKAGREAPPRLFDLTSLQVECNKKWGWSAEATLRHIQSLYEKKVTTYPRVDTTYLSEDLYPKIPGILSKMSPYAGLTEKLLIGKIPKSKKVFDNAKVTDHHAIIPTGESPAVLVGDERKLYHLIALRFIAAFYPDCLFRATTVDASVGNVKFRTKGKLITSQGWREVYGNKAEDSAREDDSTDNIIPPFEKGEKLSHQPYLQKKTTQPPKPYTEGTLLRAMESAGKSVEDETLREALKENGIGRPSTRAAIIETLFKRHYIKREKKNIIPTQAGKDLIATIEEKLLKSAELTGIWENKLRRIERGDYSPKEFVDELKSMISKIVRDVISDDSLRKIEIEEEKKLPVKKKQSSSKKSKSSSGSKIKSVADISCPLCGEGHLLKGKTAYGCSRYREGCNLRLNFTEFDENLTPAKLQSAIKKHFKKHL
ncbi:MAG: DNA topoisomerase 3 [Paramuribaculum sp.]|nr:DNA topoisomerase 3 [Paramuribaculum sp.]